MYEERNYERLKALDLNMQRGYGGERDEDEYERLMTKLNLPQIKNASLGPKLTDGPIKIDAEAIRRREREKKSQNFFQQLLRSKEA